MAKSFKVYPGDKVKIEAYAKYYNPQSTTSNLAGFAGALTAAFGVSGASTGEALKAFNGLNSFGGIIGAGGGGGGTSYPKAFVNILLFDKDYNFLDIAFEQINGGEQIGASPKAAHDYMSREYTVKEVGYAFMYISNESPTNVETYFDDVVMSYTPSNIVQYNEYYAHSMPNANSWTRENITGNNFLGNGGTELNATTGLMDLFFRNYDPTLGRFMQVDPLASLYHNQSTYQYGNNDPIYWSDPSGAGGDEVKKAFDRADADFDALNLLAAGGGMFGSSYNILTYGSASGFGGATSIGGFGSNYHGYWEKYLSGGHYEIAGARNPTSLDAGSEGQSYFVSEYSRRFVETGDGPGDLIRLADGYYRLDGSGYYRKWNDGILPDYTLESAYVGGKILGPIFGATGRFIKYLFRSSHVSAPAAIGISGRSFTAAEVANLFKGGADDAYKILYRGMTGSESGSGALFLTDDAAYAATYTKNGFGVSAFKIPAHNYELMKLEGLIGNSLGQHAGMQGTEYIISNQAIKEALLQTIIR